MRVIVFEDDMVEIEIIYAFQTWVDRHLRELSGFTTHLFAHLIEVILIDMNIAEGMDESSRLDTEEMSEDMDEEGVRSDIERYSEKEICRSLVELTIELPSLD